MNADKESDQNYCIDEEHVRALIDLEKITRQSVSSLIKEGLEMYIKFKKDETSRPSQPSTMFSPIVLERLPKNTVDH